MVKRNANFNRLRQQYLFQEINRRKQLFLEKHPETKLLSLGIGDTTEPIPAPIAHAMEEAAAGLGTHTGYRGYGPEQGMPLLREKIASEWYHNLIQPDEVFISDGAKCDIGRLQVLFGNQARIAVQDPAYPVYVDSSLIQGQPDIVFMPCLPEDDFFPDLSRLPPVDLLFFCSPNNPTGTVATKEQLEALVEYARRNHTIIIFDAAYSAFIQDPALPKSIYEIEGAKEVAIEVNSFSKIAGFTGVRLGWTIVPHELKYEDGTSVRADWYRLMGTVFNGASSIAQMGGLAVWESASQKAIREIIAFYLENARLIRDVFVRKGYTVYGGSHAPYIWVRFPERKSWDVFQELLEKAHLVSTPGSGFGPGGEGFLRFSAFGSREMMTRAVQSILKLPG